MGDRERTVEARSARRARWLLAGVVVAILLAFGSWPCFVYRGGDSYSMASIAITGIGATLQQYREEKRPYPTSTGRKLLVDLAAYNPNLRLEVHDYANGRYSMLGIAAGFLSSHHGHYELRPISPIPPGRPIRGPKRPLAALQPGDPMCCVRPSDRSEDLCVLFLGRSPERVSPGTPAYDAALAGTTDE